MNSSTTSTNRRPVLALLTPNWIEIFAVPIASAIMEYQPILLILYLFGQASHLPDTGTIIVVMVGFQWWASWNQRRTRQGDGEARGLQSMSLDILLVLFSLALIFVTHTSMINDTLQAFITVVLIIYAWLRSKRRARIEQEDTQLIDTFKFGFGVILFVTLYALLAALSGIATLSDELLRSMPIFFLAAFLALSFSRIAALQKEQRQHPASKQKEGTSSWLFSLTLTWLLLIIASLMLETLPNSFVAAVAGPIWWFFGLLASLLLALLAFLGFLLFLLFGKVGLAHLPLSGLQHKQVVSPPTAIKLPPPAVTNSLPHTLISVLFLCLVVVVIVAIAIRIQRRLAGKDTTQTDEEELRENLDREEIRRERRQQQQNNTRTSGALEQLAPESVRARYRAFLTSLAESSSLLQRHPSETPHEYQDRVQQLKQVQDVASPLQAGNEAPTNDDIFTELTQTYIQERYGGQHTERTRQTFLSRWVPHLVDHLTTKITQPARIGEDRASSDKAYVEMASSPTEQHIRNEDALLRHVKWED